MFPSDVFNQAQIPTVILIKQSCSSRSLLVENMVRAPLAVKLVKSHCNKSSFITPGSFLVGSFLIADPHEIPVKPMEFMDVCKISFVFVGICGQSA